METCVIAMWRIQKKREEKRRRIYDENLWKLTHQVISTRKCYYTFSESINMFYNISILYTL